MTFLIKAQVRILLITLIISTDYCKHLLTVSTKGLPGNVGSNDGRKNLNGATLAV
jgi:hypothetical protein